MIVTLLIGMGTGFGLWLFINAFVSPAPTSMASALATLNSERPPQVAEDADFKERLAGQLIKRRWADDLLSYIRADVGVTGQTEASFVSDLVLRMVGFAAVGFLFGLYATSAGLTSNRPFFLVVVPTVLAVAVAIATVQELRKTAKRRREEFLEAMVSFIAFIRMASGFSTLEAATVTAVEAGAGWPFEALAAAMEDSVRRREDLWFGLERLGHQYDVRELRELASTLKRGKTEGSTLIQSLASRSKSLQDKMLNLELARANRLTEVLTIPLMGIAVSFVVFIGFPALRQLFGL